MTPLRGQPTAKTRLTIKVVPGASRDAIAGWLGDALKVRVSAPPEKGRANAALLRLLAAALGVPESSLAITAGATSARKTVEIEGLDPERVRRRLGRGSSPRGQ